MREKILDILLLCAILQVEWCTQQLKGTELGLLDRESFAHYADQLLALMTVKLAVLTDEESLALRIEWNKGLSKCDCWGDFVAQAQIDKIKRENKGIKWEE